jgi:hypothetical protein
LSNFAPAEVETIRLIDQRQTQLLEDIDLLNARILALLEEYNPSKAGEETDPPQSANQENENATTDSLETAA